MYVFLFFVCNVRYFGINCLKECKYNCKSGIWCMDGWCICSVDLKGGNYICIVG